MCGIGGAVHVKSLPVQRLERSLEVINDLQSHRGPDGEGVWRHPRQHVGLAHRRLSIIDLSAGHQPMADEGGNWIAFNGEIYNYVELRQELGVERFRTNSDTEVILQAYRRWGADCVNHLRGMFAFALWDEVHGTLFCARDRFGIKPFHYARVGDVLYFASEAKALLPFLADVAVDREGLADYLTFQFCLDGKTLFQGIRELPPAHTLTVAGEAVRVSRYWQVYYHLDFDHTESYFQNRISELLVDSVNVHLRADVPVGAYLSGGLDSSIIASLASAAQSTPFEAYTGKFSFGPEYDETRFARDLAEMRGFTLREIDITVQDFLDNIERVIYHLDQPVAGPGSFPQYMVSRMASQHRKVVLGGQGGDEIFGGYTRYLIAYFEQCIRGAIDGTIDSGNFIVTYESIIPNLTSLRQYKPLLKTFWAEGLFDDLDRRYFRLIDRAPQLSDEIDWDALGAYSPFEAFQSTFRAANVPKESYFDSMTHFDFKTLLPALLHVEDRVSMAHGLESRVPFLDHPLVELAATIPSNVKFKDGQMKHLLRNCAQPLLPRSILDRKDKMGFPVPLTDWIAGEARSFVRDILSCQAARERELIDNRLVVDRLDREAKYGRQTWGLLCLEMWQQAFVDRAAEFRGQLVGGAVEGSHVAANRRLAA